MTRQTRPPKKSPPGRPACAVFGPNYVIYPSSWDSRARAWPLLTWALVVFVIGALVGSCVTAGLS